VHYILLARIYVYCIVYFDPPHKYDIGCINITVDNCFQLIDHLEYLYLCITFVYIYIYIQTVKLFLICMVLVFYSLVMIQGQLRPIH